MIDPAQTVVGANSWVIHQDKDIFGADADTFRPERWLVEDTSDMRKWTRSKPRDSTNSFSSVDRAFLTFGGGARICIGRSMPPCDCEATLELTFCRYCLDGDFQSTPY